MVDKTENLNKQAITFKKGSTALRRHMWWKNMKLNLIILIVLIVSESPSDSCFEFG